MAKQSVIKCMCGKVLDEKHTCPWVRGKPCEYFK